MTDTAPPHIAQWTILGPGSIGCLWAAHWAKAGTPVRLIGRTPSKEPLHYTSDGTQTFTLDTITAEQVTGPIDHLLITTKAQQTQQALDSIRSHLSPKAIIVVLQNGMAATELSLAPHQQLFAATTTDGAYRDQAKHVVYAGRGKTLIGPLATKTCDAELLMPTLPSTLDIEYCDDIALKLWQKLAINCAINGLTVVHDCRNGELLQIPAARQSISALCHEIIQVTQALNLGDKFARLEEEVVNVLTLTANNINSMLQDVRLGKRTEIHQLNGYLCRQADKLGINVPHNQQLLSAIQQVEANTSNVLP